MIGFPTFTSCNCPLCAAWAIETKATDCKTDANIQHVNFFIFFLLKKTCRECTTIKTACQAREKYFKTKTAQNESKTFVNER
ncbi:hypothetical protein FACS189472_09860 [Alphaproteobacteria bacterium]|nr:hypothetical protein FACS189472_09860 [Alphaproteobacteria bacterium]